MTNQANTNFLRLYNSFHKKSILFVKSYIHDDMVTEDLVSEVLIKYWEYLKTHSVSSKEGLLVTMLKNKSLDYLRRKRKEQDFFQNYSILQLEELDFRINTLESLDVDSLFTKEIYEIVDKTLEQMPEKTRLIFKKSRYSYLTNQEISDELGISVKSVEYHMSKALKLLRHELKDYLPIIFFFLF